MYACALGCQHVSLTQTDPPALWYFVRVVEPISRCGKADWVAVLSEEAAPSAVWTRKHRGGGKGPEGSGKQVPGKKPWLTVACWRPCTSFLSPLRACKRLAALGLAGSFDVLL